MGAGDWAGEMAGQLHDEFGTCDRRNLRITSLVRRFVSHRDYEGLFEENIDDDVEMFIHDLPDVLREQPGESIEDRWNSLMDQLGFDEMVEGEVYLEPWNAYDQSSYDMQLFSKE